MNHLSNDFRQANIDRASVRQLGDSLYSLPNKRPGVWNKYRKRSIINRDFYYFFTLSHVGFSLMIGGIPVKLLKMCSYKTRAVNNVASTVSKTSDRLDRS